MTMTLAGHFGTPVIVTGSLAWPCPDTIIAGVHLFISKNGKP
jgi:hypothetical protein